MSVETSIEGHASTGNSKVNNKQLAVDSVINWQLPVLAIMFVSVVLVAIKTVVHRHESRMAYIKLQTLEKERDKLAAQWSRLKLEQATTLNQVRVEQYARWDLNMKIPKASEVKIIQEPEKSSFVVVRGVCGVKVSASMVSAKNSAEPAKSSKVALGN